MVRRRWWHRATVVAGIVGATLTSLVAFSGPAQAEVVITKSDRMVLEKVVGFGKTGATRGLAPTAQTAAAGSVRFCKGSPVACGVITAGAVVGSVALVATSDKWVPWIESELAKRMDTAIGSGNCDVTPVSPADLKAKLGVPMGQRVAAGWAAENLLAFTVTYLGVSADGQAACNAQYNVKYRCKLTPTQERDLTTGTTSVTSTTGPRALNMGGGTNLCSAAGSGDEILWLEATPLNKSPYGRAKQMFTYSQEGATTANAEISCRRSDGSEYTITRPYAQIATGYVQMPTCAPGEVPINLGVEANGFPGTGVQLDLKPRPEDLTTYPTCANSECLYRVLVDGEVCQEGDYLCVDWTRLQRQSPSRVECYYGPYLVPVENCYFMERFFENPATDNDNKVVTDENTDGDPDTYTPPAPAPKPTPTATSTPTSSVSVTSVPTPTATATPVPGFCASPYPLGPVLPETAALVNNLGPRFAISTVGGYREADPYPDHPSGRAADFMVYDDHFKGERLATYAHDHAAALGVDYIMWDHKIWSQARAAEGWRTVADRGSPTANHEDHVHITVLQAGSSGLCSTAGETATGNKGECFPTGWASLLNPIDYVVKPMRCVLTELFIPSDEVLADYKTEVQGAFDDSTPGIWVNSLGSIWDSFEAELNPGSDAPMGIMNVTPGEGGGGGTGTGANCIGPRVPTGVVGEGTGIGPAIYPFSACNEPVKSAAAVSHAIGSFVVAFFGGLRCVGVLGAAIGWVPPLAFTATTSSSPRELRGS